MNDTGTAHLLLYRPCRRGCRVCVGYPLRRGSEGQALYKLKCRKQQMYDLAADYGIQLPPARKVVYSQSTIHRRLEFAGRYGEQVEVKLMLIENHCYCDGILEAKKRTLAPYGGVKTIMKVVIENSELQKRGITIVCR